MQDLPLILCHGERVPHISLLPSNGRKGSNTIKLNNIYLYMATHEIHGCFYAMTHNPGAFAKLVSEHIWIVSLYQLHTSLCSSSSRSYFILQNMILKITIVPLKIIPFFFSFFPRLTYQLKCITNQLHKPAAYPDLHSWTSAFNLDSSYWGIRKWHPHISSSRAISPELMTCQNFMKT